MDWPRFESFSTEHVIATLSTFAVVVVAVAAARYLPERLHRPFGRGLAASIVVYRVGEGVWRVDHGERWFEVMPLHLSGLSLLLTAYVLWSASDRAFQVAYFWVTVGASMSLITPVLAFGFPSIVFWSFYAAHAVPMFGIGYALFVYGLRPRARSIVLALVAVWAAAVAAAAWNLAFDTNFMFLSRKPYSATPLDYFGPWPWYLVTANFVGLALFALAYLPFAGRFATRSGSTLAT